MSDADAEALSHIASLENLHICHTLTEKGVGLLCQLPKLRSLRLTSREKDGILASAFFQLSSLCSPLEELALPFVRGSLDSVLPVFAQPALCLSEASVCVWRAER